MKCWSQASYSGSEVCLSVKPSKGSNELLQKLLPAVLMQAQLRRVRKELRVKKQLGIERDCVGRQLGTRDAM